MKKIVLLMLLLAAGGTWLTARGHGEGGRDKGMRGGRGMYAKLFESPEQGQVLTGLEGEITLVDGPRKGIAVFKTADKAYILPRGRMLKEGSKLTIDAYVMEPKEGSELEDFEYEGKKILPALLITMAKNEDGESIPMGGPPKGRGRRGGRGRGRGR